MKSELISIVVPVYQGERYINECIKSLQKQSYDNIEIIIVNDGSTDNTALILNKMKEEDERLVIYHQDNEGVAIARNVGISLASGKYIVFVDADDTLDVCFCEKLIGEFDNENKLVISGVNTRIYDYLGKKQFEQFDLVKLAFQYEELYLNYILHNVCGNMFLTEIAKKCHFPNKVRIGEDLLFCLEYLSKIDCFKIINYCGYYYRFNTESATKKYITGDFETQILLYQKSINFFQRLTGRDKSKKIEQVFLYNVIDIYTIIAVNENVKTAWEIFDKYISDRFLLEIVKRSTPKTLQRKILKWSVLHKNVFLLSLIGFIKKIKVRLVL